MVLEVLATAVTQGEKKKGRSKIHYLQWHGNYIQKTLKVSIPKLLELISEFRKVGGCNIDIQKYAAFLYTNSKLSKRESREQSCLKITSKRIKYLGISLTKEMKDLSSGKYETFIKVIEDDKRSGKISHAFEL